MNSELFEPIQGAIQAGSLVFADVGDARILATVLHVRESDNMAHIRLKRGITTIPAAACSLAKRRIGKELWISVDQFGNYEVSEMETPGSTRFVELELGV